MLNGVCVSLCVLQRNSVSDTARAIATSAQHVDVVTERSRECCAAPCGGQTHQDQPLHCQQDSFFLSCQCEKMSMGLNLHDWSWKVNHAHVARRDKGCCYFVSTFIVSTIYCPHFNCKHFLLSALLIISTLLSVQFSTSSKVKTWLPLEQSWSLIGVAMDCSK